MTLRVLVALAVLCCKSADAFTVSTLPLSLRNSQRVSGSGLRSVKSSEISAIESRRSILTKALSLVGTSLVSPAFAKAEVLEDYKLYQILSECKTIPGKVRFVAVTAGGAVLETIGDLNYNYVGPFELPYPPYGMYLTLAGPNSEKHLEANFECTIGLDKVTKLAFDVLNGPEGELYAIRLRNDAEQKPLLTILLNYDLQANGGKSGKYTPGAVEKWKEIRKKYANADGDVAL